MKGLLIPAFKAIYGPGTKLGGEQGKQMNLILVCSLSKYIYLFLKIVAART